MAIILVAVTIPNGAVGYCNEKQFETPWPAGSQPDASNFFFEKAVGKTIVVGPPSWWPVPQKISHVSPPKEFSILSRCVTLACTKEFYGGVQVGAVDAVLEQAKNEDIYVIGNERLYQLFMPYAQEIWVARVRLALWSGSSNSKDFDYFPEIHRKEWRLDHAYTWHTDSPPNAWPTSFFHYIREEPNPRSNN